MHCQTQESCHGYATRSPVHLNTRVDGCVSLQTLLLGEASCTGHTLPWTEAFVCGLHVSVQIRFGLEKLPTLGANELTFPIMTVTDMD